MFDWDDVPEELGGPNRATLEISAEVEEEDAASKRLSSRLHLDEGPTATRHVATKAASLQRPAGHDRSALRALRVGELRRRLAEAGVKIPSDVVEKDDLVSLLMSAELEARAAEAEAQARAAEAEAEAHAAEAEMRPLERAPVVSPKEAREGDSRVPSQGGKGKALSDVSHKASTKRGSDKRPPAQRLERMVADATQDGAPEKETPLQKSLRLQFQQMKESQQRRKEEAQRRAAQKSEGDAWETEQQTLDGRGPYVVTKKTFATASADRGGEKVDNLIPGQVVEVLEVVHCDSRIRARISDPPCWFSIANHDTGTRFAERQEPQPLAKPNARRAPSRFAAFSKAAASLREPSPESQPDEPPSPPPVEAPAKSPALALAAKSGSFKKVMKLLQEGANVNAGGPRGETALFDAAAGGSIDVAAVLLLHSADPGKKSMNNRVAADGAPAGPLKSLLELTQGRAEARANMASVVGAVDPLLRPQITHMLQERIQASMMAQQMERPQGAAESFGSAAAARSSPPAALRRQALPQVQPAEELHPPRPLAEEAAKAPSDSALLRATKAGNLKEVMRLLSGKADPNAADVAGETALFEAAAHGFADVTAALLVHGADAERKSVTGLVAGDMSTDGTTRGLLAFFRGDDLSSEQLEFILEGLGETMREIIGRMVHSLQAAKRGLGDGEVGEVPVPVPRNRIIDTGNLSEAPLAAAARAGDLQEVQRLLGQDCDPNVDDDLGETPLFEAVSSGFSDITALLLLRRADPLKKSDAGGLASDLTADRPCKLLLDFFSGASLSNEEKYEVVYGALQDQEVRDDIAARFRAENMQEAYQHMLRKLRA